MLVCIMVKHTQKNYKESLVQQPPNKCFCILWPAQACMMPARGWQSVSPKFSPLTCSLPGSCWDSSVSFCTRHPLSCLCRQPHLSQANLITSKYVFTYCWTQCLQAIIDTVRTQYMVQTKTTAFTSGHLVIVHRIVS